MKTNTKILLKVPEGLIRKANEEKILNDVIFYYQLKSLTIEGHFKKNGLIRLVQSKFRISESSIWRKVKKLVELGYLIKSKEGYSLIRYDAFFKSLHYDIAVCTKSKSIFGTMVRYKRRGSFKIFKILVQNLDNFLSYIAYEEIKLNFQKQEYNICKSSNNLSLLIPKKKLNYYQYINKLLQMKLQNHYIKTKMKHQFINFINTDVTLSCLGLSKLLGFLSSRSGYLIEKNLVKLGLIDIQKRLVLYETNPFMFRKSGLGDVCNNFLCKQSLIYYNLPNKIFLLV